MSDHKPSTADGARLVAVVVQTALAERWLMHGAQKFACAAGEWRS
ncbi:hypothetical protein AB0M57_14230 [Streptomyces sp. NPDC051597]